MIGSSLISPCTFRHAALPGGSLTLPNEPEVRVSLQKTIVTTPVAGRDFAVIEIISAKNYRIQIAGISDAMDTEDDEDALPQEVIRALNNLARINASLEVECEVLSYYGITSVVVESFDANTGEFSGQVSYRFELISDDPPELQLLRESALQ